MKQATGEVKTRVNNIALQTTKMNVNVNASINKTNMQNPTKPNAKQ